MTIRPVLSRARGVACGAAVLTLALLLAGCGDSTGGQEVSSGDQGSQPAAEDAPSPTLVEEPIEAERESGDVPTDVPVDALGCVVTDTGSAGFGLVDANSPGPFTSAEEAARAIIDGVFITAPAMPERLDVASEGSVDGYRLDSSGLVYRRGGQDVMRITIQEYPAGGFGVTGWEFCSEAVSEGLFVFDPAVADVDR